MGDVMASVDAAVPSEVESVVRFVSQVEGAAALLTAAHADDGVRLPSVERAFRRRDQGLRRGWYTLAVQASSMRLRDIMTVLRQHPAHGSAAAAELAAFRMLSKLTPADSALTILLSQDRGRAFQELGKQMDLVRQQLEATAALVDTAEPGTENPVQRGFPAVRDALLERAGGALSLTEAANALGISRQGLHKRISSGSALGMMRDGEIVVPRLQFSAAPGKRSILRGIDQVTKVFRQAEAGAWSELQFLLDPDPNLGRAPIDALKDGAIEAVVHAARAYVQLTEG
ncbi:MAG: hypothetical protein J0H14_06660 [Alphaproteobacteria bacterium]|nr:hypothetical protein [Alphaproteobacteria bacterium]